MSDLRFSKLITAFLIVKNASTPEDWTRPGEEQGEAQKRFPGLVETSRLHLWMPGDDIPKRGKRFLIGAATYSLIEMYILDALNEWLEREPTVKVDVFDLSAYSLDEIAGYIPNAQAKSSPVLGIWSDGQFVRSLEGGAANKYLREYFQLDAILEKLTERENEVGRKLERLSERKQTGFVRR